MKEQALALIAGLSEPRQALNRLREYLQAILADVRQFLERSQKTVMLTIENVVTLLKDH